VVMVVWYWLVMGFSLPDVLFIILICLQPVILFMC